MFWDARETLHCVVVVPYHQPPFTYQDLDEGFCLPYGMPIIGQPTHKCVGMEDHVAP